MINPNEVHFPMNVINVIAQAVKVIDPDVGLPDDPAFEEGIRVFRRPLDLSDGSESIGIYPSSWVPDPSSKEMGFNRSPVEPTIQDYRIVIQSLVLDGDEENGIAVHSLLSSKLRHILYRDPALAVVLPSLSVTHGVGGLVERLKTWDIDGQTYLNNTMNGQFVFLSTTEIRIRTVFE